MVEICFIPGVVGVVVGRGVVGDAKIKNKGIQIFFVIVIVAIVTNK